MSVVRIKRPLNTEPLEALLLNCKKRRTDPNAANDNVSTVLKFAATVENQEEDVFKYLGKPSKEDLKEQFKKHIVDINSKLREENKSTSRSNRYKVINQFRASEETASKDLCTVVDLENDKDSCDDQAEQFKFVYDLYYTNSKDFEEADLNEFVSVYPLSDHLIYDNDNDQQEVDTDDDSDSNAENNWRNDYPDESDVSNGAIDTDDEDMISAFRRVKCDDENDLSSSDGYLEEYEKEAKYDLDYVSDAS